MKKNTMFNKWFLYEGDDPAPDPDPAPVKTFTQEDVNRINAEHKRAKQAAEARAEELNNLVQDLQNKQNMSVEEQEKLVAKLEELENANLTAEQKLARQQEKIKSEYDSKLNETTEQSKFWQNQYSSERIKSALLIAAEGDESHAKAYNSEQIMDLLHHKTVLAPVLDDDGNQTGEFTTVVKGFTDFDKEGNPIKLDLSVTEAVNRMREMDRYANLFHNSSVSGLDVMVAGRAKSKSEESLSMAEYMERHRKGKLSHQRR